jgi:hypothetical protein
MNPWIPIIIGGVLYKLIQADSEPSEEQLLEEKQRLKKELRACSKRLKRLSKNEEVPKDTSGGPE